MSKPAAAGRHRAPGPASTALAIPHLDLSVLSRTAAAAVLSGLVLAAAGPAPLPGSTVPALEMDTAAQVSPAPITSDASAVVSFDRQAVGGRLDPETKFHQVTVTGAAVTPAAAAGTLATPLAADLLRTSGFGQRTSPITGEPGELHSGQDFAAGCGTAVTAAAAGRVTFAEWHPYGGGNRVVIDHGNGVETTYNHLSNMSVEPGDIMERGNVVGFSGTTGASTGCHLHFEVLIKGQAVDPLGWL